MHKTYNLYYNLGYWFLLLIMLAVAAFYTSYLSVFFQPTIPILHTHFALMAIWMAMLAPQPFLIMYKRLHIHWKLDNKNYSLVPFVLASGFLMNRYSYYWDMNLFGQQVENGIFQLDNEAIHKRLFLKIRIIYTVVKVKTIYKVNSVGKPFIHLL